MREIFLLGFKYVNHQIIENKFSKYKSKLFMRKRFMLELIRKNNVSWVKYSQLCQRKKSNQSCPFNVIHGQSQVPNIIY